jgi:hypothetical protein
MSHAQFKSYLAESLDRPAPYLAMREKVMWGWFGVGQNRFPDMAQNYFFMVPKTLDIEANIRGQSIKTQNTPYGKIKGGYGVPMFKGPALNKWAEERVDGKFFRDRQQVGSVKLNKFGVEAYIFRVTFLTGAVFGGNKGPEARQLDGIYELAFSRYQYPVQLYSLDGEFAWDALSYTDLQTSNEFVDNDMSDLDPRQVLSVFSTVTTIAREWAKGRDVRGLMFGRKVGASTARDRIYGGLARRIGGSIGMKTYDFPQGNRAGVDGIPDDSTGTFLVVKNKGDYDAAVAAAEAATRDHVGQKAVVSGLQAWAASLNKPKPIQQIKY